MIDFPNVAKDAKIVVAMSGGVDSSTTVALLQEAGYKNVVGMTLLLHETNEDTGVDCKDKTIIEDCTRVAEKLQIEHHFIEMKEEFMNTIINPFINGFVDGITVNPCITCNRDIKFGTLLEKSKAINADILVTGHYIKWTPGIFGNGEIHSGTQLRDQSYFLSQVRREAIKYMRFPLSNFTKVQTRAAATRFDIHVAQKKSSSDLCFVTGKSSFARLMEKSNQEIIKGNIIDTDGKILAQHEGIHLFTVGQRKGIGVGGQSEPYFVIKIDKDSGNVVVGTRSHLATKEVVLENVNWLGDEDFSFDSKEILSKVRASQPLVKATLIPIEKDKAKVIFSEEIFGVAKGQICAFYDQNRLLGGGYL